MRLNLISPPPLFAALAVFSTVNPANAQDADLIKRGEYIAVIGDCAACHTGTPAKPFAGEYPFKMPMGVIISTNITPSKTAGIGNWSEKDFKRAVSKGVRPDGSHLYPAMPYTAYAQITNEDMKALYAYMHQGVKPVNEPMATKTKLVFPFNMPGTMFAWNLLFANNKEFVPDPKLTTEQNRGKYLTEGLAHCSTCHSPRNAFLAEDKAMHLAGSHVDGWYAPNITSDKISGIGGWDNKEIADYLQTGHVKGKAQAGGPMAEAIEYSLRYLTNEDALAIASYLKTVPAIRTPRQTQPAYAVTQHKPVSWTAFESNSAPSNSAEYRDTSTTDGAILYNTNCAACHGINGTGSDDGYFPSLINNTAVGSPDHSNLVMAIVEGIHRTGADQTVSMPAFSEDNQRIHTVLTSDQIAAVANYVTTNFGNSDAKLTGSDITSIRNQEKSSILIRNAVPLAIGSIVVSILFFLIVLMKIRKIFKRKKRLFKR